MKNEDYSRETETVTNDSMDYQSQLSSKRN